MINESIPFKQINISVITISDTRNKDTDKSGAYLIKAIKENFIAFLPRQPNKILPSNKIV